MTGGASALDLVAQSATFEQAMALLADACRSRQTTAERIRGALSARRRLRWRGQLSVVLDDVTAGAQSALELHYLRRVERAHRLPRAARQSRKDGRGPRRQWADAAYEEWATVVELDGRLGHEDSFGRLRDVRRDNAALLAGEVTLRFGWADVLGNPCEVASQVGKVLRDRGWTSAPKPCGPACRLQRDRNA